VSRDVVYEHAGRDDVDSRPPDMVPET
jgi:hypothetical protein